MIDLWISAKIPDPNEDPLGYVLVADHMMHGPCGEKPKIAHAWKKVNVLNTIQSNSKMKQILLKMDLLNPAVETLASMYVEITII
jgi:hypothetical protein